jgi:alpha-mannosidase
MTSSDLNTPAIKTEILLFNDHKRIEFRYQINKDYTTKKEAVYFAFPAAIAHPEFAFASQQGWIDPAKDLMKGGSLEWFTVQQWMAVHDNALALGIVPIDAPLASFGDINRGTWPGKFKPASGTIFSYAMNNYWHTNYRAGQGGDFTFRYVITSGAQMNSSELTRLGWEEMRPVELDHVVGQDKVGNPPRPLPPTGTGFLDVSGDDVTLVTWKEAEDGDGTILRLAETAGHASDATVRLLHSQIASAHLCSGMEESTTDLPVDAGTIHVSFRPFEVLTVRISSH